MARFTQEFLDEVSARSPIVDVAGGYITLQKRGGRYTGLCPFHNEKTPSFFLSPDINAFHCFGCGKGGSVFTFIMEQENLDFPDAVRFLAKRAGMEVPEEGVDDSSYRRLGRLKELCAEAARYFHRCLSRRDAQQAAAYMNRRGLSSEMVTRFGLGWAPDEWNGLETAMKQKGYTRDELLDAGLMVKSRERNSFYDRFRGRLIFPIINQRGEVVGFGGRILGDGEPKYLNSPESLVYNKSRNLFGINLAKRSKADYFLLCEGYMDVITMHQYGFDSAIASCGTALTEEQAGMLAKYGRQVILLYDSDEAGQKAAARAIRIFEKTDLSVRVLTITGAKDPDEYLHTYGADRFRKLLEGAEEQTTYRLNRLLSQYDLSQDGQKAEYLNAAAALIAELPGAIEREIYGGRVARSAGLSEQAMAAEVERVRSRRRYREKKREEAQSLDITASLQPAERTLRYTDPASAAAEEGVLRLVMTDPSVLTEILLKEEDFSSPLLGKAYSAFLVQYNAGGHVGLAGLEQQFEKTEMAHLSRILSSEKPESREALSDYVGKIQGSHRKRDALDDSSLLALRDSYLAKKGTGG